MRWCRAKHISPPWKTTVKQCLEQQWCIELMFSLEECIGAVSDGLRENRQCLVVFILPTFSITDQSDFSQHQLWDCWVLLSLTGNQSLWWSRSLPVGRVVWQGLRTNNSGKIVKYNHLQPGGGLTASLAVTDFWVLPSLNIHPSAIIVSSNCHTPPGLLIEKHISQIISDAEIVLIESSWGLRTNSTENSVSIEIQELKLPNHLIVVRTWMVQTRK